MDLRSRLSADTGASRRRFDSLERYFDGHVLSRDGRFVCRHGAECCASTSPGRDFREGQLSYVGSSYELAVDERPFRILFVAMDAGSECEKVTMPRRRAQIVSVENPAERNQHMRGTVLGLRMLIGGEDWSDAARETWGDGTHVLESYAMANVRLCSVKAGKSMTSYGTSAMTRNCSEHLEATIEILEPTIMVTQGAAIRRGLLRIASEVEQIRPHVEQVSFAGVRSVLVSLRHPAHGNWSSPRCRYFGDVVVPALQLAQRTVLAA